MRLKSWLLSLALHAVFVVVATSLPMLRLVSPDMSLYTIELVAPPERMTSSPVIPPSTAQQFRPRSSKPLSPESRTVAKPTPSRPQTKETPSTPPATDLQRIKSELHTPIPRLGSGVVAVSPVKRGWSTPPATSPSTAAPQKIVLEQGLRIHLGDTNETIVVKEGAETRTLRMLAVRDYTIEEYSGLYTEANGRFLQIIDGREVYGSMLFYDSDTGLYRRLSRFGGMIYTYGPDFSSPSPVSGSIIFLTTKEGISNKDVDWHSRILWLPEGKTALFGNRLYFHEETVRFKNGFNILSGLFVGPPVPGPWPAVVMILDGSCPPLDLTAGLVRVLAREGVAVLILQPVGCGGSSQFSWARSEKELAADVVAAVHHLQERKDVIPDQVGIWSHNQGARVALLAAAQSSDVARLILTFARSDADSKIPSLALPENLPALRIPSLWIFADPQMASDWQNTMTTSDATSMITVEVIPSSPSTVFPRTLERSEDPWIVRCSPVFMLRGGTWIRGQMTRSP